MGGPKKYATGRFEITGLGSGRTFQAWMGDGPAIVTEGYGGWITTPRPRDIGFTEWEGRSPMAIEIPFMIDRYMEAYIPHEYEPGEITEAEIRNLEFLCGVGGRSRPDVCQVDGNGAIPHDNRVAPGIHRWVIESLSWDRDMEIRSPTSSNRLRAGGTLTIRQYLEINDLLRRIHPDDRAKQYKMYKVKKGDTLKKIAAKKSIYGDATKWKVIAWANFIRDPRKLHVGQRLRIPPL